MGPYAFSQAFIAGFFAFAAVSSLLLWLRTRNDWTMLLLAAVCAIGSVQSVAVLSLATSETIPEAMQAQRLRGLCGLMNFASIAWLYAEIAHVRARGYLWFVTITALTVAIMIVVDIPLLGTVVGLTQITLPWGETLSQLTRTGSSPLVPVVYAIMASTVVFNVWCARRLMTRDRVSGVLLVVATLVSLVPLVSGALIDITSAPIPYIGTLSIAAFILVVALQLAVSRRRDEQLLEAERTQRTLEHRLAQAQKMEALGQLAGGVAHDFNNILTVIAGHADMLLSNATADSKVDLAQIRLAATRAASMTAQLLAFSRQSIMEPTIVNLNAVVASTQTLLRRTIGEHIELVVLPASDLWNVRADANQLGRVLVNLAINARDAMPRGGRLTIETANVVESGGRASDAVSSGGRYVMVSITDTGSGMTPQTKAHLFEPFFTTKELGKGTGLGLAVVDGIVKQTGGYVDVESQPGYGAVFKIYFPATDDQPAADASPADEERRLAGSETILIIEDDPGVRTMTQSALRRYGYRVLVAANGDEAVRIAQGHDGHIALVVTDVLMPGLTGPQIVERLRAKHGSLAALFVSGYTADAIQPGAAPADGAFLQKPFTPAVLAAKMRSMLDRESSRAERYP